MRATRIQALNTVTFALCVLVVAPGAEAQVQPSTSGALSLHAEAGAGSVLSDLPRTQTDPATRVLALGLLGGVALHDQVTALAGVRWATLPDRNGHHATALTPTVGLRIAPRVGTLGRAFVEFSLGVALMAESRRFSTDLGLGFEFAAGPHLSVGPVLRYTHIVQPDQLYDRANAHPVDPRWLTLGLTFRLHTVPRPRPEVSPEPVPPTASSDLDEDGVDNTDDRCALVPAGPTPDPARPGCPLPDNDRDRDGLRDPDDRCPDAAPGATPDRDRPGCPAVDTDGDGLLDADDLCPITARGATPDPVRAGCPRSALASSGDVVAIMGPIDPIVFPTASDRLVGRATFEALDRIAARLLLAPPTTRVVIEGHTDPDEDLGLGSQRALRVQSYLERRGLPSDRLMARSLGSSQPAVNVSGGRPLHRRVTLRVMPADSSPR